MIKNFVFISGLLIMVSWARGQTLVGSAGGTIPPPGTMASTLIIEYAVGEPVIFTIQTVSSDTVTQGLLQPLRNAPFVITEVSDLLDDNYSLLAFPNPSTDAITIETSFKGFETIRIMEFDGHILKQERFDYSPISVQLLPAGIYYIQFISKNLNIIKSLKIIKS